MPAPATPVERRPPRSTRPTHDALIFGGGLAGSILAEMFLSSGRRPLVVDNPLKSRCSRVAAGIINPIGGKRLKLVWKADTLIPCALSYYRSLERKHRSKFFHPRPIARLFSNSQEESLWAKRSQNPDYQRLTAPLATLSLPEFFHSQALGFAIPEAGYLDTTALLNAIASDLQRTGDWLNSTFRYDELAQSSDRLEFRDYSAPLAIFAEGHLATENPWFNFVPHKPAKGVIATIAIENRIPAQPPEEQPIILKSKFIVPRHDGTYQVGATYNWEDASDRPDEQGIEELNAFLNQHLERSSWEFLSIKAGVRPATAGAYPLVGRHPDKPNLYCFNGFGSKGSLQIPYFARALLDHLYHGGDLPSEVLPSRFVKKAPAKSKRWIATEIARERIEPLIEPGDLALDGTAGNGHDTLWLCRAVGHSGHVFAFDLQEAAISTTRQRLQKSGLLARATLQMTGHERLLETTPEKLRGTFAAAIFNLGFLPGGDAELTTQPETTIAALDASLALLRKGGVLGIVVYPSHPGGREEVDAVVGWTRRLPGKAYRAEIVSHPKGNQSSPYPIFVTKL